MKVTIQTMQTETRLSPNFPWFTRVSSSLACFQTTPAFSGTKIVKRRLKIYRSGYFFRGPSLGASRMFDALPSDRKKGDENDSRTNCRAVI